MTMKTAVKTKNKSGMSLALAPYSAWSFLFILVPLLFVAYYAFTDNNFSFTTENITRFFTEVGKVTGDDGSTREVHKYLVVFVIHH